MYICTPKIPKIGFGTTQTNKTTNVPQKHNPLNPASTTGYGALGCAIGSVVAIKNKSFKWHKYLAYAAGILATAHIALIEWYHHKK